MKKILNSVVPLAMAAMLAYSPVGAGNNDQKDKTRPEVGVTFMGTYQNTKLNEVNSALKAAGAPFGVSPDAVETWDDVYKGSVGTEWSFDWKKIPLDVTLGIFFASGDVQTDEQFTHPQLGPGTFKLKQKYTTTTLEAGGKYALMKVESKVTPYVVGGLSHVWLSANTHASATFDSASSFNQEFTFKDSPNAFGWYIGLGADTRLSEKWSLYGLWRYNSVKMDSSDGTEIDFTAPVAIGFGGTYKF